MQYPKKREYEYYWVYLRGKVIKEGKGAPDLKELDAYKAYKGYLIEEFFDEASYNKDIAEYKEYKDKELRDKFLTLLVKEGINSPSYYQLNLCNRILKANTLEEVTSIIRDIYID